MNLHFSWNYFFFMKTIQTSLLFFSFCPFLFRGFQDSFTSLSNILHSSHSDDVTTLKSVFYSNVILFFRSMYTYFNLVNPGVFGGECELYVSPHSSQSPPPHHHPSSRKDYSLSLSSFSSKFYPCDVISASSVIVAE